MLQFVFSLSDVHPPAHFPPAMHRYAPHDSYTGSQLVADEQVPVALSCLVVSVGHFEVSTEQVVLDSQALLPLQFPLRPQRPLPVAVQVAGVVARAAAPLGMFVHVPTLLDSLQLWQPPVHAALQQTFSSEHTRPVPQSESATQTSPAESFPPQRLFVFRQVRLLAQSAFDVQLLRHVGLVALQT